MKTTRAYSTMLISMKPQPRRFLAHRGVALLRAWRLRFAKLESERLSQIEFDFAGAKVCRGRLVANR